MSIPFAPQLSSYGQAATGHTAPPEPECTFHHSADAANWVRHEVGRNQLAGVFNRGGRLVHTPREGEEGYIPPDRDDDHNGPAQIQPLNTLGLKARIQYGYTVKRELKNGECKPDMIPQEAVSLAFGAPELLPNVRRLRGVVHTPIVRRDGSILDDPGYDQQTKLLYIPDAGLRVPAIPDAPTEGDVRKAVDLLDFLIGEFRFVTDSDRANYFGMLLTPLMRELTPPPYKLGAIGAPQPGSGKTLLAEVLCVLHGGVVRTEMPGDEELRKDISTILDTSTGPVVHYDNVTGLLRSSVMAGLLTSAKWQTRKLGGMDEQISTPNDRMWVITGNNLAIGGDLPRRTLWCTIDPGCPDPQSRTGFTIPDLKSWAAENRGDILAALLTLIRAWVVAGRPQRSATSDSYGVWTAAIDGILTVAGVAGRFDAPETTRETISPDEQEWADLLAHAQEVFGQQSWTAKELLAKVDEPSDFGRPGPIPLDALPEDIVAHIRQSGGKPQLASKKLGMWLRNREGRWVGGRTVRNAGMTKRVVRWRVELPFDDSSTEGESGVSLVSLDPPSPSGSRVFLEEKPPGGTEEAPPDSPDSPSPAQAANDGCQSPACQTPGLPIGGGVTHHRYCTPPAEEVA